MSTPQSRFCANCGFPALPHDVNCSNCGRALAGAAPPPPVGPTPSSSSPFGGVSGIPSVGSSDPTLTPPGVLPPSPPATGMPPPTGAPAPRSGMPGWVIGLIACLVVGPILLGVVGIGAAIIIPGMTKFAGHSATDGGKENVQAIWTAEKSYASAHGGKYSAFTITPTSQTDPGFTALAVTLPRDLHHNVVAAYDEDGKSFWIVATVSAGDPLYAKDSWELSSDSPTPVHTYDGVADKQLVEPKAPIEIAAASLLGGGAGGGDDASGGLGGLTSGGGGDDGDAGPGGHGLADDPTVAEPEQAQAQAILATDSKSQTAKANLEAIWAREKAWKASHHSWLAFDEGNAGVWAKLGVRLPQPANHTYSAKVDGGALVLTAEGNLDDDPFIDQWQVDSATGVAVQEKSDALNMDLTSVDKLFTAQAGGGDDE